jgi:CBS domain containing-hemolysin-like protein
MRRERTQMAVVIDEHGGTAGVVTLEDLFEEVVGEIEEGPGTGAHVYRDRDGRLRVPGTMRLDEVGQAFDIDLEHEEVDSVSGLVLTLLGRPPAVRDKVKFERLLFEVTAVKGHGVDECAVCLTNMDSGPAQGVGF